MQNSQFVQDCLQLIIDGSTKSKRHGNLFLENGVLYSYGYHYPLMWVQGKTIIVNTRGYSNTTSKHITYALRASYFHNDYTLVETWVNRDMSVECVINGAKEILENRQRQLDSCVRPQSIKRDGATLMLQEAQNNYNNALQLQ